MATIDIKASTVMLTEKRAAEICSILAEIGVEFKFMPSKVTNPRHADELVKDTQSSVRMLNLTKIACEEKGLDWNTITVQQFANSIGRSDLVKLRNCGKRSLEEIIDMLHDHGLNLMIQRRGGLPSPLPL